jgi:hypothetical protein
MQTLAWAQSDPLSQYRWKNRLLLIFAADIEDQNVQATRELLEASECQLEDRDMVIGWILERGDSQLGMAPLSSRAADNIRSQFRIRGGGFFVVLVGKDGGVKARYAKAPDLHDVFSLIDGMPMRRSEMRERGLSCDAD